MDNQHITTVETNYITGASRAVCTCMWETAAYDGRPYPLQMAEQHMKSKRENDD